MVPVDAQKFRGELSYFYIEDENGCVPKAYEQTHGSITLATSVVDGNVVLDGVMSPYKPQCFNLRLSNHSYGMLFQVDCNNTNDLVKDKIVWRRAINREYVRKFFQSGLTNEMELHLVGDAPEVAHAPPVTATLTIVKLRHDFHLSRFRLVIPLAAYDVFIERYNE